MLIILLTSYWEINMKLKLLKYIVSCFLQNSTKWFSYTFQLLSSNTSTAYKYIKIHILKEYDSTEKKEILMLIIQPPSIFFVYILKLKKFEQTTIKWNATLYEVHRLPEVLMTMFEMYRNCFTSITYVHSKKIRT